MAIDDGDGSDRGAFDDQVASDSIVDGEDGAATDRGRNTSAEHGAAEQTAVGPRDERRVQPGQGTTDKRER